jgi:PTH1 family peptidyl-tRNA hydrolase
MNVAATTPDTTLDSPYLLVGLGNPGRQYRTNRHNIGFMVIDHLVNRLGGSFSRLESRALVTKSDYRSHRLVIAKPQTYMNLSGQAVGGLARFYKIPLPNLMVVYDDVDLPLGTLRMRPEGGAGGQKGMLSIIDSLGTQEFPRLRVGIGRPPGRMQAADYVLQDFSKAEAEFLPHIVERAGDALLLYVEAGLAAAMNQFNAPVDQAGI